MNPLILALVLGSVMGVYSFGMPYIVVTFFPPWMNPVGILVGLAIPVAAFWPARFDRPEDRWLRRLGRRAAVLLGAASTGAAIAFLSIAALPGYLAWADRVHRQSLERQGRSETEIVAALEAHRQTPLDFLGGGFIVTAVPGAIAIALTTALGARRPRRRTGEGRTPVGVA